jgi:hypothetical protein
MVRPIVKRAKPVSKFSRPPDGRRQVATIPVSVEAVMASPRFQQGVTDARRGKPFPADYDVWVREDKTWSYERGRLWGRLVPRNVPLKRDGKVTDEAVNWYLKIRGDVP